jgi:hypothetical protein
LDSLQSTLFNQQEERNFSENSHKCGGADLMVVEEKRTAVGLSELLECVAARNDPVQF